MDYSKILFNVSFKNMGLLTRKIIVFTLIFTFLLPALFIWGSGNIETAGAVFGVNEDIKQVKKADDSTVYYLDHKRGIKKAYISEEAYLSYGNKWSDIKIVDQKELDKWRDAYLIKTETNPAVYYIENGQKYLIRSEDEFVGLGLRWEDVLTVSEEDASSYVLTDGKDFKISSILPGGQDDGRLNVGYGIVKPSFGGIPTGSVGNEMLILYFSAENRDVLINSLALKQIGLTEGGNIKAVYLTDENGNTIGNRSSVSERKAYFGFGNEPIVVKKGEVKKIIIKADFARASNVVAHTVGFGLESYKSINANAFVAGDFPINGNKFKLITGNNSVGEVKISSSGTKGKTIQSGSNSETVANFRLNEVSGVEDIFVNKIVLTNKGNVRYNEISNVKLYDGNGRLVAQVKSLDSEKVVFEISGGYKIKKRATADFIVKADFIDGRGREARFLINNSYDILATGANSGFGVTISSDENFPIGNSCGNNCNTVSLEHKTIFITASQKKESELRIYENQEKATIGNFELRNDSGDIYIEAVNFRVEASAGAPNLEGELSLVNAKDGGQIAYVRAVDAMNKNVNLNINRYKIKSNEYLKLAFISDIAFDVEAGDSYKVFVDSITYNVGDNRLFTDKVEVYSQDYQVSKPTLYVFPGEFTAKDLAVAGDDKIKIATFIVEASADEDVKIKDITIGNVNGYLPVNYANGFTNLALYKGSARIGEIVKTPDANSYTFYNVNTKVYAGKSIELNVRADASYSVAGTVKLYIENIAAEGYKSKVLASVGNENLSSPVSAFTQIKVSVEGDGDGNVYKGEKNNIATSIKIINNSGEKVKLKSIIATASGCSGGLSYNNGFSNLKLGYENKNSIKRIGSNIAKPVAESNKISLGNYKLEPGASLSLNLYVDADNDIKSCGLSLRFHDLTAEGYNSKVEALTESDPTGYVNILGDVRPAGGNDQVDQSDTLTTLNWPTVSKKISYYFHDANYPFASVSAHEGIDIDTSQGSKVKAAAAGTVSYVYDGGADGYSYIMINHADGLTTVYGHVSRIDVGRGDVVKVGETIGLSGGRPGTSGAGIYSTGPHLHFEVHLNGTPVDPMEYLK